MGATLLTSALSLAAASIHLLLTPEHFEEGLQFGLFFLAATAFQYWLAIALLTRPGPPVFRAGVIGSALIAGTWVVTRLFPPPLASAPEPVTLPGVLATGFEVAAIVALLSTLPAVSAPPSARRRRLVAAGTGLAFGALVLLASGVVTPIPASRWTGPDWLLRPYPLPSWRLTGIWLVVAGRWSAIVPWLTLGFAVCASVLVAWTVSLALRLPAAERGAARRRGVIAAVPACATVPVCCGAPLAAFAGGVAVGTLFRWTPWLMTVSLVLLAWNVLVLRRAVGAATRPGLGKGGDDDG
ncbi:MAG TPA: hypothetical protein VNO79_06140 [Actinomycetota bacterium]|nr:hypothetical protein [Actinomycetota bacterium]